MLIPKLIKGRKKVTQKQRNIYRPRGINSNIFIFVIKDSDTHINAPIHTNTEFYKSKDGKIHMHTQSPTNKKSHTHTYTHTHKHSPTHTHTYTHKHTQTLN